MQAYIELYGEERINVRSLDSYVLVRISQNLQEELEENYTKLLNGKSPEEYETEAKAAYALAYGSENGTRLAEGFVESQTKGVQNIKTVVQGTGMLIMIAGQIIPVGGQIATAMVYGGMSMSAIGGSAVQFGEALTKKGGITEEDKREILQELTTSAALMGAGGIAGKVSSMAYAELVLKNCPRMLAVSAKYGTDVTLSLLGDYAITGEIDLTGEGISQIIEIATGLAKTRGLKQKEINKRFYRLCSNCNSARSVCCSVIY